MTGDAVGGPRRSRAAHVEVVAVHELWFGPGDPVRAASGIVRLRDGWLVIQDDSVHGAWWWPSARQVRRLRLLPRRGGLGEFDEESGPKHLKPDLEAACEVEVAGRPGVLALGSGSLAVRTVAVLVRDGADGVAVTSADLTPLYERVRGALGLDAGQLNLEGACVVGDRLRWFQRGHGTTGVASASVDVSIGAVLEAMAGTIDPSEVLPENQRTYDLGTMEGLRLAITDAVALPDGTVCVSAAAEDAPDAVADGPVSGSALAVLDGDDVRVVPLPRPVAGWKVEGLALQSADVQGVSLLAVVDNDHPRVASQAVHLRLRWTP